jgi:hypothetical protein
MKSPYILTEGKHSDGKKDYQNGDVVWLTEAQANGFKDKIRPPTEDELEEIEEPEEDLPPNESENGFQGPPL